MINTSINIEIIKRVANALDELNREVIYVLNNRLDLVTEICKAPEKVLRYLSNHFNEILNNDILQEAVIGNLDYGTQQERLEIILNKLKQIIKYNQNL